jgi:RNA polymerase sigma-70 factor (ECF subfamily)
MDSKNDADLVRMARAGNRDAYGELIRRYQHQIWGLACILLDDRFEAEDVTQEAFLRAWLNLDLLSDPGKFAPWLRRIVFGVAIDWLRVFRPDLYRLSDLQTGLKLSGQPAPTESALARLQAIELRQRIWDAIARLPPKYRLPLTMFHLDGLSHTKVAETRCARKHRPFVGDARASETGANAGFPCRRISLHIAPSYRRRVAGTNHKDIIHASCHGR